MVLGICGIPREGAIPFSRIAVFCLLSLDLAVSAGTWFLAIRGFERSPGINAEQVRVVAHSHLALHADYDKWLEKLAPHEPVSQYLHNRTGEDNADAHMKRQLMGREVVVAVTNAHLDFGPWEQIFYGEFDGRRKKRALVKIIGE